MIFRIIYILSGFFDSNKVWLVIHCVVCREHWTFFFIYCSGIFSLLLRAFENTFRNMSNTAVQIEEYF